MAKQNFTRFSSQVANMPHIPAKVIEYLDIADVVSCLRTNKAMRSFIVGALENNARLQRKLDRAVTTASACSEHLWTSNKRIVLDSPSSTTMTTDDFVYGTAHILGFDDKVFVSSDSPLGSDSNGSFPLDIYNLDGKKVSSIPLHNNHPKIQVIGRGKFLVNNGEEVQVLTFSENQVHSHIVHMVHYKYDYVSNEVFEKESVYDHYGMSEEEDGRRDWLTMFSYGDGLPDPKGPIHLNLYSEDEFYTFHKKVISTKVFSTFQNMPDLFRLLGML